MSNQWANRVGDLVARGYSGEIKLRCGVRVIPVRNKRVVLSVQCEFL